MSKVNYSVVIPFFNEEDNLSKLHEEVIDVLLQINIDSEVIYVNDGSTDNSLSKLKKAIKSKNKKGIKVVLIELKRNFGQTAAIIAGIETSKGEMVSLLDADLQNDPSDLPRFVEKIGNKYDAVFGWRKSRKDANLRSILSRIANNVINKIFSYPYIIICTHLEL